MCPEWTPLKAGDPGRIRTSDLQLRRLLLYPLSYGAVAHFDADALDITAHRLRQSLGRALVETLYQDIRSFQKTK
jgi:hypothetical protein